VRGRSTAADLPAAPAAGPPAGRRRAQEPGQPLLPRAPEVLDVVVRAAGQVRGDPGPLVAELSLQVDHHALLLRRELAAPSHRKRHQFFISVGYVSEQQFFTRRPCRTVNRAMHEEERRRAAA